MPTSRAVFTLKTELDVHSIEVTSFQTRAAKWQVFRHVTECNTNKLNTLNVSVFQTLGGGLGL